MAKEKKKPGVMIYFKPMREQAASLNDARLARLFRAMLAYADPDCGQEPDFHDDEVLLNVWIHIRHAIIRDDDAYHQKNQKKQYAVFCRFAKEKGFVKENDEPPISREEWEELGCPTFNEWKQKIMLPESGQPDTLYTGAYSRIQPDTVHTGAYSRMQSDAGVSPRMPTSTSTPFPTPSTTTMTPTFSTAKTPSETETELKAYARTHTDSALAPSLPPEIQEIFTQWIEYRFEQGKELAPQSQVYLAESFRKNTAEYGTDAVKALVREAITNGWKTLYFEKLRENPSRYDPQRFPAPQNQSDKNNTENAMDDLRTLQQMFREDGS